MDPQIRDDAGSAVDLFSDEDETRRTIDSRLTSACGTSMPTHLGNLFIQILDDVILQHLLLEGRQELL